MRVKQLLSPLASRTKLVWDRITSSRITTLYFVFSVLHCLIQVILQARAFTINAAAANTLHDITVQGNASHRGFPVLGEDLRICEQVPNTLNASSCQVVWDGTPGVANAWDTENDNSTFGAVGASSETPSGLLGGASSVLPDDSTDIITPSSLPTSSSDPPRSTVTVFAIVTPSTTPVPTANIESGDGYYQSDGYSAYNDMHRKRGMDDVRVQTVDFNGTTKVTVHGAGFKKTAILEESCIWVLNYPVEILQNTKREDIVFIAFQFWLLGMSFVAILNESIPHIISSLLTHILATAWAAFQIYHTANFRKDFVRLTINGACKSGGKPINLLPLYWSQRGSAELPSLILNVIALFISAVLTWRLIKLFGWQTFKRIGASVTMHRIYTIVLVLSITIQLGLFFMVVTVALWIDQLYNGAIGQLASLSTLYKATFTITLLFMVPWLMTGWFAVRREAKVPMMIFLGLCIGYLAGYGVMFLSTTFRWTFVQWRFFSLMASASVALTVLSFVLGVLSRINFGKGLLNYLNAEEALPGDDFEPAFPQPSPDEEKGAVLLDEKDIVMFATTFGPPGYYATHGAQYEEKAAAYGFHQTTTAPLAAHVRSTSADSYKLRRNDTRRSDDTMRSSSSLSPSTLNRSGSNSSQSSTGSRTRTMKQNRWVIE